MMTSETPDTAVEAYYFGCWGSVGHFFWTPGMRSLPKSRAAWWADTPWGREVDGHLTPGRRDRNGRLPYDAHSREHQGEAALHHKHGWTSLALHDFTVDSRPASNSVFFFHAELNFDEAVAAATEHFPQVIARIGEIQLVDRAEQIGGDRDG